jgi:signal transduction histidine kinase
LVDGYISLRRQRRLFETDMHHDIHVLGSIVRQLTLDLWNTGDRKHAWQVIEDANDIVPSIDIRWVWLDAAPGDPNAPRASPAKLKAVVEGHEASFTDRGPNRRAFFYSYFPAPIDPARPGALEVREPLSALDRLSHRAMVKIVGLTATLVVLSGAAALLLGVRLVGGPLDQVVRKVRRIADGDFSGPLHLSGHNELDELAVGLNTMCEQLDQAWTKVRRETEARVAAVEQLRHEDRLKTVGRLASGIAHELGTPLNVISGYAGMIAGGSLTPKDIAESAQTIKTQSERIARTIRQLLDFARQRPSQKTAVALRGLARQSMDLMAPLAQKQQVELILADGGDSILVRADAEQIKQVLLNLLTNAVQAMPHGGKVEMAVVEGAACPPLANHAHPAGPYACISIQDEGEGIPAENLSRIFEPFFTTKGPGKGTGLGLSIVDGILREHGGWITVESEAGKGSRFCICLPREPQICPNAS